MINLLDGVSLLDVSFSKETLERSLVSKDPSKSTIERITAYEDIIDLEVGDTSLVRARNIEREIDLRQVYFKFEGSNPTGTQKDRIAFAQCLDCLRRGFDSITLASCGNYGASIALAAKLAGLNCIICIPENYHTKRIVEMEHHGAQILRTHGSYESAVAFSKELAVSKEYYDANPGGSNATLQFNAYAEISYEIYDTLRDAPKVVAVPVSNGTLLVGIYKGFVHLYKRGKTSRIPQLIAGSSANKNPIIESIRKKKGCYTDLSPDRIKETTINEPLVNWHSFDGAEAYQSIVDSNGFVDGISDQKLMKLTSIIKNKEGLQVLPASVAGLAAFIEVHNENAFEGDRYVAILTARN